MERRMRATTFPKTKHQKLFPVVPVQWRSAAACDECSLKPFQPTPGILLCNAGKREIYKYITSYNNHQQWNQDQEPYRPPWPFFTNFHHTPRISSTARSPTVASTRMRQWLMVLQCRPGFWAAREDRTCCCWTWRHWPWVLRRCRGGHGLGGGWGMMYFVPYRNSYGKDKLGIVIVFFLGGWSWYAEVMQFLDVKDWFAFVIDFWTLSFPPTGLRWVVWWPSWSPATRWSQPRNPRPSPPTRTTSQRWTSKSMRANDPWPRTLGEQKPWRFEMFWGTARKLEKVGSRFVDVGGFVGWLFCCYLFACFPSSCNYRY